AIVTITVGDGSLTASTTFQLTVTAVNDAPVMASLSAQTTLEDTPITVLLVVSDVDSALGDVTLSAMSDNAALLTPANIAFGGSGANRCVTLSPTPDATGSVTVSLIANDGLLK